MTFLDELVSRYPSLAAVKRQIDAAFHAVVDCYDAGGKLLVCGNGGSAADADHIVGELMKGYLSPRQLPTDMRERLRAADPELGPVLGEKLQGTLSAINISAISAFATAFGNDVRAELTYAQATSGYGRQGDVLMGLSTSGNAVNVRAALVVARALGMRTIGLTGADGGRMAGLCDVLIAVPATRTFEVQELHLPVYHCLCAMVEAHFFP
jgi:D-sedoheptulose 7-phosphate isomerase